MELHKMRIEIVKLENEIKLKTMQVERNENESLTQRDLQTKEIQSLIRK